MSEADKWRPTPKLASPPPDEWPPTKPGLDGKAELRVMQAIVGRLEPFDSAARERMVRWLYACYVQDTEPFG